MTYVLTAAGLYLMIGVLIGIVLLIVDFQGMAGRNRARLRRWPNWAVAIVFVAWASVCWLPIVLSK